MSPLFISTRASLRRAAAFAGSWAAGTGLDGSAGLGGAAGFAPAAGAAGRSGAGLSGAAAAGCAGGGSRRRGGAALPRGAWAGEIGQTQFMMSTYETYAVDFDGDGRADLIHSAPDVLASTANFLRGNGWQRGAGWNPGQPNFAAIKEWNKSDNYARAIALFASKLDGE